MKTIHKLDKTFGTAGTTAGFMLFIAGIIITFYSLTGLVFIVMGAFIGFTSTSSVIDHENNSIKLSTSLFGVIKTGKWIKIEPFMKMGIRKSNLVTRTYSRTNQQLVVAVKDFRVVLYDADKKQIMTVLKDSSLISAKEELHKLCNELGLEKI